MNSLRLWSHSVGGGFSLIAPAGHGNLTSMRHVQHAQHRHVWCDRNRMSLVKVVQEWADGPKSNHPDNYSGHPSVVDISCVVSLYHLHTSSV